MQHVSKRKTRKQDKRGHYDRRTRSIIRERIANREYAAAVKAV